MSDKPDVSREEMLDVLSDAFSELQYHNELHHPEDTGFTDRVYMAIRSVLTSTPERGDAPHHLECQYISGKGIWNCHDDCLHHQDARGEGETRQVGIVFKCGGCGRELEAFQKPDPEGDTEWLLQELETAFFSMWSANYGVDTKKEKKALELIKERLQKQGGSVTKGQLEGAIGQAVSYPWQDVDMVVDRIVKNLTALGIEVKP